MVFGALYYKTLGGKHLLQAARAPSADRSEPLLPTSSAAPADVSFRPADLEKHVLLSSSPRPSKQ